MPPSPPDGAFLAYAAPLLAGSGIGLRAATGADGQLIATVYASTRADELRDAPWSEIQKRQFTDWQSAQQEAHYALHYPGAERLVIEREGAVGRMYVDASRAEVRLMEITLLPKWRNQGTGTILTRLLVDYADAIGRPASLHVEPFNPARRMYVRLGFAPVETRGIYEFMVRAVPGSPS